MIFFSSTLYGEILSFGLGRVWTRTLGMEGGCSTCELSVISVRHNSIAGVGNLWLASQIWLFYWLGNYIKNTFTCIFNNNMGCLWLLWLSQPKRFSTPALYDINKDLRVDQLFFFFLWAQKKKSFSNLTQIFFEIFPTSPLFIACPLHHQQVVKGQIFLSTKIQRRMKRYSIYLHEVNYYHFKPYLSISIILGKISKYNIGKITLNLIVIKFIYFELQMIRRNHYKAWRYVSSQTALPIKQNSCFKTATSSWEDSLKWDA